MAARLACLVLVLVSVPLYQRAEALGDVNCALTTYNRKSDKCKGITDSSPNENKRAADDACVEAFRVLDQLGINSCKGWRNAGCRVLFGQSNRQCTCFVSNDIPTPFRECAKGLKAYQQSAGIEQAPLPNLQRRMSRFHEEPQVSEVYPSDPYRRAGSSTGAYFTFTAGTSSAAQTAGGEGSQRVGAPRFRGDPSGQFACNICPRAYKHRRSLTEHKKSHTTYETTCHLCDRIFTKKWNLKHHLEQIHSTTQTLNKLRSKSVKKPENFPCGTCGNKYASVTALRDHERSHGSLDTHCFPCKTTLGSRTSYKVHLRRIHPEDARAEEAAERKRYEEDNPEKCEQCPKRFKNADGLAAHKKYHDGQTQCDECGLVLSRKSCVYKHKKRAHSKKQEQ